MPVRLQIHCYVYLEEHNQGKQAICTAATWPWIPAVEGCRTLRRITMLIRAIASRTQAIANYWGSFLELIRCLVWVVSELGHGCDSEFELTGAVVGGGSEVDEILESSSHPLG